MTKSDKYDWKYCSLGGAVRIAVQSGEDIARLGELDQKLWTIHSCPADNLVFDPETLKVLDADGDGRIRVNEVAEAARWATAALKDKDLLLKGASEIAISDFNDTTEEGKLLAESAKSLLKSLGLEKDTVSVEDIDKYMAGVADRAAAAKEAAIQKAELDAPYGENTAAAADACNALREKIADYFVRCKLVSFNEECRAALDVSVDNISKVSGANIAADNAQIAACPLARPEKEAMLPLCGGINPAWQAAFSKLKSLVFDVEFGGADSISEEQWNSVLAKIDAYTAAKAAIENGGTELLDSSVAAETALAAPLNRFIRLYGHLYEFLHNYVSFNKLYYALDESAVKVGKLYIDQRCCELCLNVKDMGQHGDMAGLSGMFLVYCDCTQRKTGAKMQIVAALTVGSVRDIRVGKNAVFYDREGRDWDATVVKVVENPINIRQAFWSPYRKFFNWCGTQINKIAADKESKSMANLEGSAGGAMTNIQGATPGAAPAAPAKPAFDIAKFCGIFAAIGLALGMIGGFLVTAAKAFVSLPWWGMILVVLGLMLIISGPSMLIAWSKLRHRNLAPVLNANGWAVNTSIPVSIPFGKFLTHQAKYPKVNVKDPFAPKRTPLWRKVLRVILILAVAGLAYLYFTDNLSLLSNIWPW